ncbi:MAG: protein kinase [Planctomycetes bacterium]|nr:protein kinase [Planctomycetota bacterium]MCB9918063.1 protein kinase [Planctomycetota bacterium]
MAILRFSQGVEHALDPKSPTTLGAGSDATIRLGDPAASELHCVIRALKNGGFGIKDLGSDAGTYLDGRKIDTARLTPGCRIRVGATEFDYLDGAADAVGTATTAPSTETAPTEKPPEKPPEKPAEKTRPSATPPPRRKLPGADVDLAPGTHLNGYEIEGVLGHGGMGTVYRATQLSLGRKVAIKVLAAKLAEDPSFVRRFESEARAAGRFNHPNVVQVFDVDEDDGRPFYSMELLPDGSLEDRLGRSGPLAVDDAIKALRDAAQGLAYADELGLVHRDIKPDNLMPDAQGNLKICDLGLATDMDAEREGKILGTPHFLSPEQAQRKAVDHRSDIYSLGCSAYRLMTGKNPFPKNNVRDILRAHLSEEAPSVRAARPDCPEPLDALVRRMMAKDPDARPRAGEIVHEIDAMLEATGSSRGSWIAIAIALVAIAGGAIYFLNSGDDKPITIVKSDPDAERVRQKNRENEAEIARLQVREDLPLLERAEALDRVAKDHAGTEAAKTATREAEELRTRHAAEVAAEKKASEELAKRIAGIRTTVDEAASDPVGAWQRLTSLAGAATTGSEFAKAIDAAKEDVTRIWTARATDAYERFETAARAEGSDLSTVLATLEESLRAPPEGLPEAVGRAFEERTAAGRELVAAIRKSRRDARRARVGELAKVRDQVLFGETGVLALVRKGQLSEARNLLSSIDKAPAELADLDAPLSELDALIQGGLQSLTALGQRASTTPFAASLRGADVKITRIEGARATVVQTGGGESTVLLADEADLVSQLLIASGAKDAFGGTQLDAAARDHASLVVLFALAEALPEARAFLARQGSGTPQFPWSYRDLLARLAQGAGDSTGGGGSAEAPADALRVEAVALDALASMLQAFRDHAEIAAGHWAGVLERRAASSLVGSALGIEGGN